MSQLCVAEVHSTTTSCEMNYYFKVEDQHLTCVQAEGRFVLDSRQNAVRILRSSSLYKNLCKSASGGVVLACFRVETSFKKSLAVYASKNGLKR